MSHHRLHADFPIEELEVFFSCGDIREDFLDRTQPSGRFVDGLVDDTHAPAAQFPENAVVADRIFFHVGGFLCCRARRAEVASVRKSFGPSVALRPTFEVPIATLTGEGAV